jgi:hypothetical protein
VAKKCQWAECKCDAIAKERFCPVHRKAMLNLMEREGYLTPLPKPTRRPREEPDDEQEETT